MRNLFTVFMFVLSMLVASSTVLADLNDGLVAKYPFNGNANDESGNGNHGTVNGATLATDRFGNANSAYSFDGLDDYIEISDSPDLSSQFFTIGAWIKFSATSAYHGTIAVKGRIGIENYGLYVDLSGKVRWQFTSGGGYEYLDSNSVINDDQFHHVVGTYDGIQLKIYIDGALDSSSAETRVPDVNNLSLRIGMRNDFGETPFLGIIDEVSIYNRALSDSEVQALYGGLVAYYPFNGNANDESGNWNHGTVNGATLTTDRFGNVNSAYSFDGNDYIVGGDNGFSGSGEPRTESAWIKTSSFSTQIVLFYGTNATYSAYYLGIADAQAQHCPPETFGYFYAAGTYGFGTNVCTTDFINAPDGQWHHVTATYDGIIHKVYVDGELSSTGSPTTNTVLNGLFYMGVAVNWDGSFINYLNGSIDDIRIYNRALTESEIQVLYDGSQECVQPPAGLVSWWPGDGDANDIVDGNHGTLVNGATFASGKVGQAFSFDGMDDYIIVEDSISLMPGSITLTGWFNFSSIPSGVRTLMEKALGSGIFDSYAIWYYSGVLHGHIADNTGDGPILNYPFTPTVDTWYHIVYTFDDTTDFQVLYVNGEAVASGNISKSIAYDSHPVIIGGDIENDNLSYFFPGKIDEVGIYNRALSASEIQTIFNAGSAGKCKEGNEIPIIGNTIQLPATNEFSLEQFTQATFVVDIVNQDTISHTATVEVLNPDENLSVTLQQAGLISLAGGETQTLLLDTDATFASPGNYDAQIKVTNDDGAIIYSNVSIIVTAQGAGDLPDLALTSRDISFSQLNLEVGDTVTISARIQNKGTAAASNAAVHFFDSDTYLGEVELANIEPGAFNIASLPVILSTEGVHFIRVVADPLNVIMELDYNNNEASQLIQVGSTANVTGNILVTGSLPTTVVQNQLFTLSGHAVYEIIVNGQSNTDHVVKGGAVQVTVQETIASGQEWLYGDINTNVSGDFSKLLQAPSTLGDYRIILTVTDQTFTGQRELAFSVVEPSPPPPPPVRTGGSGTWTSSGGGTTWTWTYTTPPEVETQDDIFVFSEDIVFSNDNPALSEEISIFATIHYWANSSDLFAENVPINFYVTFPGFPKIKIGETVIDLLTIGEPYFGSIQMFTPWQNQAEGIYIVEVEIDPGYVEANVYNNAATRAIIVGELTVGMGAVTGHVLDPSGGVGGVSIELLDLNGNIIATTFTDNTGGYLFQDVTVGQKHVRILTPVGYIVDAETKSTDVTTGNITVVNFNLTLQSQPVAEDQNVTTDEDLAVAITLTASDLNGDPLTFLLMSQPANGILTGNVPNLTYTPNPDYNGGDSFTFKANDGQEDSNFATVSITVNPVNDVPVVNAGSDVTINEGDTFTASGDFVDPDPDVWSATVDYGDDSGIQPLTLIDKTFEFNHIYEDNGSYTVTVTINDDANGIGSDSILVTVNNVSPTVGPVTAPLDPTQVNAEVIASSAFTDPGILDTHTAVWDWGDGVTSPGTVTEVNGSGTVSGSYMYLIPGVYTITLTVTDKDGDSGTAQFQYVVIYDPDGGFVTGGGWITSPIGAYLQDPTLTGKATFGFVSKYKKGATIPTGETEFQFKVADLNFHSSEYEWLVVTGSDYARYKGSGTINGAGDYKFMIWAGDDAPDTFRIKIWEEDALGNETIKYDNGSDQPIGGGSIVVHSK